MPSPSDMPPWHRMPLSDISVNHRPDLEEMDDWTLGIYYEALNKSMDFSTKPLATSREDIIHLRGLARIGVGPSIPPLTLFDTTTLVASTTAMFRTTVRPKRMMRNFNAVMNQCFAYIPLLNCAHFVRVETSFSNLTEPKSLLSTTPHLTMSSTKQPIPGFSKNWCSRQSSSTGRQRYYFARGDYYTHAQDEPPTQEDHEQQLRLSEKAKKRKDRSSNKRKKERQTKRVRCGGEEADEEAVEPETRAVTFADDKRQRTDTADAKEEETKPAAEHVTAKAQAYEDDVETQVQRVYGQYRQHQEELVEACGVVVKNRSSYTRVSLVCSTNRPVCEQEVVNAIFQHINSACDGSIKKVRVIGEVSTDVRICFEHWDGHTTEAIQQLLRWSDGFYFTSMNIFRPEPRVDPSCRLFVCNIPYEASGDDLLSCLSHELKRQQVAPGPTATDPFIGCTMQHGFAFVECKDAGIASACLSLDALDLFGRSLRIERPRNYKGSVTKCSSESEGWAIHTSSSSSSPAISELTMSPSIRGRDSSDDDFF